MAGEKFEPLDSASPDDRERMERLAREANEVLAAAEAAPQEETLREGRAVLEEEAQKEVAEVEDAFEKIFSDPQSVQELFATFERNYGWHEGKSRAMVGALRHALNELYHRTLLATPDERNPHPEGHTAGTRNMLLSLIADDYGAEVMREIAPLVEVYVEKGREIIHESKQKKEGEEE